MVLRFLLPDCFFQGILIEPKVLLGCCHKLRADFQQDRFKLLIGLKYPIPPFSLRMTFRKRMPCGSLGKASPFIAGALSKFQNDAWQAIRAGLFKSHFQEQIEADIQNFIPSVPVVFNETLLLKVISKDTPTDNGRAD